MDARILIGILIFFVIVGLVQRLVLDAIWDAGKPEESDLSSPTETHPLEQSNSLTAISSKPNPQGSHTF
jgi:hypothetical protein